MICSTIHGQFHATWHFTGVSGAYLNIFKIPRYGFTLLSLDLTLSHTYYTYVSAKFLWKDLLGESIFLWTSYIKDFERLDIQKLWTNGTKSFTGVFSQGSSLRSGDL